MLRKIGYVFALNGLAVGCGLFKNIILGRCVSEAELGLYALLLAIVGFVYPLSLVGQQTALVRFLSGQNIGAYNFTDGLSKILLVSLILTVVGVLVSARLYALTFVPILFLLVATFSSAVTDLVPATLRAQGIYGLAIFIFRGVSFFQFLGIGLLVILAEVSLEKVLWIFLFTFGIFAFATTTFSRRYFGKGPNKFPRSIWKDGAYFWGSDLSLLVITTFDRFLIPKILSLEALGLYFAIYAVLRIFDLAFQSVEFVLLPSVRRLQKNQIFRLSIGLLLVGALIIGVYLIVGPYLVSIAYRGKFDQGIYLIPYLCASRFIRFVYVIPYSIISGRLRSQCLQQLFYSNLGTMVVSIVLTVLFLAWWGLVGAAIAAIVVWTVRTAVAVAIIGLEYRRTLANH